MNDLFNVLNALQTTEQQTVLSTIIDVVGSSYRKKGAIMLFKEDGTQTGLLSGGCLEDDLAIRAAEVIEDKRGRSTIYDMTSEDDLGWGQGSGCNGTIEVLLEPMNQPLANHLKSAGDYLKQRIAVAQIRRLSKSGTVLNYIFITENGESFGNWSDATPKPAISFTSENKKEVATLIENGSERHFIQFFYPKPRLIIFGAGPDVRPLVEFAAQIGFHIILADWRQSYANKDYFPLADEIIVEFPSLFAKQFLFSPNDCVLVMTHNFQKDQEILHMLLEKRLRYLGILGPKKRTHRLLMGNPIPNWLHTPVGLSIGAEGPQEIAISILAELIQTVRKRDSYDCWSDPRGWKE